MNSLKRKPKRVVGTLVRTSRRNAFLEAAAKGPDAFKPTVYHALVVIFLEFFAWGLLTTPTIRITHATFPQHTLLCNGLIQGVKGLLSFLSAPLLGALSDAAGRKPFLLLTVTFTCAPIPFLLMSPWWYFALISISGMFAVTFSIVFAYVADITTEEERSSAYGLVSATFAASLITSPAIGAFIDMNYSEGVVIMIATAVAALDVLFILVFMPESLPDKMRPSSSLGSHITWDKADPFGALKKIGQDRLILLLCCTVLLSYLPEAGEYSCFFVYLKLVIHFSEQEVASYIAFVGILSVLAQTLLLVFLMRNIGAKNSIIFGLTFELSQLIMFGFSYETWLIWSTGVLAAVSSISYPAISSYVSAHATPEQQGVAQGIVTGIRGLCSGFGPALFGFIFYLCDVNLTDELSATPGSHTENKSIIHTNLGRDLLIEPEPIHHAVPGPPFVFGAALVLCALMVAIYMPETPPPAAEVRKQNSMLRNSKKSAGVTSQETEKLLGSIDEIA